MPAAGLLLAVGLGGCQTFVNTPSCRSGWRPWIGPTTVRNDF